MEGEVTLFHITRKLNNYETGNFRDEFSFTTILYKKMTVLKILYLCLAAVLTGCAVSKDPLRKEIKLLQKGIIKDDTSYVYALPFERGKAYFLMQGYFSSFTHKE